MENNYKHRSEDLNCIWMSSNHVAYKLCDKKFDCENCEFDKAIRNLSMQNSNEEIKRNSLDAAASALSKLEKETYDGKIIYLENQLAVKKLFGSTYYLGINPMLLPLLDDINCIEGFDDNIVSKNQFIFKIKGKWGEKNFYSPLNFVLIEKMDFSKGELPLNKWLAVALINEFEDDIISLSFDDWQIKRNNSLNLLNSIIKGKPEIGVSLMDGGEKINHLYQYTGANKYLHLINNVFK